MKRSCYKCEERYPGCHAVCERFEKDNEKLAANKANERAYKLIEGYMTKTRHESNDARAKKRIRARRYSRRLKNGK